MGDFLLVTIQVDMHDQMAAALQDDLTSKIAQVNAKGVLIDISSIKGIVLSGYGMEADVNRSVAAGFSAHLRKPCDISLIHAAIDEVLSLVARGIKRSS